MKEKGFTLIELLAVIVILAIIALIATPIILNIINDAREESNERSVELYASAVRNAVAAYQLTGTKAPESFEDLTIQYDGDVKCTTQELYEDGSFYLEGCKVNNGEKEYSYGSKQGSTAACTIEDKDGNGVPSLSDVVTCGTESFYVMFNENNEITMLSMYNLNVGQVCEYVKNENDDPEDSSDDYVQKCTEVTYTKVMQGENSRGTVAFSTTNYWSASISSYPSYVYNSNADIIYLYLNQYENYLKQDLKVKSASATLMSREQAISLGCDESLGNCGTNQINGGPVSEPAPEWVYKTSTSWYWLGTADNSGALRTIGSDGYFHSTGAGEYSDNVNIGIRPVIIISATDIQ